MIETTLLGRKRPDYLPDKLVEFAGMNVTEREKKTGGRKESFPEGA